MPILYLTESGCCCAKRVDVEASRQNKNTPAIKDDLVIRDKKLQTLRFRSNRFPEIRARIKSRD
jgi:hypothetical protein